MFIKYNEHTHTYELEAEFKSRLDEINEQKKKLADEEKEIKKGIQSELEVYKPHGVNLGSVNFVVSEKYLSLELDEEKLKREFPQVYTECLIPCFKDRSVKFVPIKERK